MFSKWKANRLFHSLLKRPDIDKAYAMVPPTDSWYDTITKVHESLNEIRKLPHETLEIQSCDDLRLRGIFYPGTSEVTVICAHGYTSHAEREWAFPGLFYHGLGYNVLIPYQRAHGLSEGQYISFGAKEAEDMSLWVKKVNERYPNGKIILHGLSMGGGIVLYMADREMENVRCIIADAPNTNIGLFFREVAKRAFKSGGEEIAACLLSRFRLEFDYDADDFNAERILTRGRYPLFLAAGSMEGIEAELDLLKAANPHETRILILPGCNHGNGMYKQTKLFQDNLRQFIEEHI